jgi:hypothetical protein
VNLRAAAVIGEGFVKRGNVEARWRLVISFQGVLLSSLAGTPETCTDSQPKRPEIRFDRAPVICVTVPFPTPALDLTRVVDRVFIIY